MAEHVEGMAVSNWSRGVLPVVYLRHAGLMGWLPSIPMPAAPALHAWCVPIAGVCRC